MDAMTLEEDQSCHALKAAWMTKTASRTIARAKLACVGGCPRGFQLTKTSIDPTKRMDPKPLNKYPKICLERCVGAGEGLFLPYSTSRLFTCSSLSPLVNSVDKRLNNSSGETVCHSRFESSKDTACLATGSQLLRGRLTCCSGVLGLLRLCKSLVFGFTDIEGAVQI